MRKIEKTIIKTFIDGAYASNKSEKQISVSTRDTVITTNDMVVYELWGSRIFCLDTNEKSFYFSFCGFSTNTTRSRLNALFSYFDLGKFYQKNWDIFWTKGNGSTKIDTVKTYKITIKNGDLDIEVAD